MFSFSNTDIDFATVADIAAINDLLNLSYRGEESKKGWTTEADLIAGETRTDEATIAHVMLQSGSVFLIYKDEQQKIIGCVIKLSKVIDVPIQIDRGCDVDANERLDFRHYCLPLLAHKLNIHQRIRVCGNKF